MIVWFTFYVQLTNSIIISIGIFRLVYWNFGQYWTLHFEAKAESRDANRLTTGSCRASRTRSSFKPNKGFDSRDLYTNFSLKYRLDPASGGHAGWHY